jgi:hypothetical protein
MTRPDPSEFDLSPIERLAMGLAANTLFIQQGFPMEVLRSEWRKLAESLVEALHLELPDDLCVTVRDPLPRNVVEVMAGESTDTPDDLGDLEDLWNGS